MDRELTIIQITQDMKELAEQYEGAASNERLWANGADDVEQARMHEENAEEHIEFANMLTTLCKYIGD